MGKVINHKVKAATLVETIVSLVVILVVFGIATTLVVQVTSGGTGAATLKARTVLHNYAIKTREQKAFTDEAMQAEGYSVKKTVSDYKENSKLKQIHYYIYNSAGKLLDDWQEIVMME